MPVSPNITFGLPPLGTPITAPTGDQSGVPYQQRVTNPIPAGVLTAPWSGWFNQLGVLVKQAPTISDLAVNMVETGAGTSPTQWTPDAWKQFIYVQTNTHLVYVSRIFNDEWVWAYLAGFIAVNDPSLLPSGLGPKDAGLIAYDNMYLHAYRWSGAAWSFLPGDPGSRYIVASSLGAPFGGSWALCDGTNTNISVGDGTVVSVTTPNLMTPGNASGPTLIGGGTVGFHAATTPSWQTGARTETEALHTHNVAGVVVQSGTGSTVGASGATGAGTAHSHTLIDTNAKLKAPSDSSDATHGGGMPDRYFLEWYMRK